MGGGVECFSSTLVIPICEEVWCLAIFASFATLNNKILPIV